jgi:hypothetical protein
LQTLSTLCAAVVIAAPPALAQPLPEGGDLRVHPNDNVLEGDAYGEPLTGKERLVPDKSISNYEKNHILDPRSPPLPDANVPLPSEPLDEGQYENLREEAL